jgi:type I restriction enzyme S subunit
MKEWKKVKLGEIVTFQRGHDLPYTKIIAGNYPVAGSNGVIGYHSEYTTNAPGITIGRSGNIGTAYYYTENFWAHNTTLYVKQFHLNVYPKFIFFLLRSLDFSQFNAGSAVPTLNRNHIHDLDILLPPLAIQERIAEILSSLDDKIDLLHRQNKTLEDLAQTLFRQYFIEDAKEDWEIGKLGDILELNYGKGLKEENRIAGCYPVFGSNGIVGLHQEYLVEAPGIVIGRKGTLGKVHYAYDNFYPIDTTYYVKPKIGSKTLYYHYFILKNQDFINMNSDSAVPGLNRDLALSIEINLPNELEIIDFDHLVHPFFEKIRANTLQIRTLTRLRDELLPKLMRGECLNQDLQD